LPPLQTAGASPLLQRLFHNTDAPCRAIMNILHITPHLGGGVGRVLLSWLGRTHDDDHAVYCLESINDDVQTRLPGMSLVVRSAMEKRLPELLAAMADADVVLIHWWNNPGLYRLLVNTPLPPCRMILWSHVAGHAAPQIFTKKLVAFPDRFVVATPWSLKAPVIRSFDRSWRDEHVRLVFTCAGIERIEGVKRVSHDHFTVGYIGTVDYCKLHPSFLRMSAAARIPGARFVVCGGERHEELRREARECGIDDAFVFTGRVENINDYLGTFDVFGYPLHARHYGTGEQALIEAMAAGLPAVVFDNGSERYLVEDNVTGLVVGNEREYAEALERLYADAALRYRLGEQAQRTARDRFSLEAMAAQWLELFRETAMLDKRMHEWAGEKPLHGARLFIESMGESGDIFNDSLKGLFSAEKTDSEIAQLDGAHRSLTRGSVFHYRSFYPDDPFLNRWCGLLERAMEKIDSNGPVMTTNRPCPLCGNRHATVIAELRFALFEENPLAPTFPWVICAACGFSFYATPSPPEHFDAYYRAQSYYFSAATSGSGSSNPEDIQRYNDIAQCLIRNVDNRAATVFDVGSGKGGLLARLREYGFSNLYAIDMVDSCIAFIRERLKMQAQQGSAAHLPLADVTPEILIYSHVLEHVYDPVAVLSEANRRLSANGIVYLEVPDASRYGEFCTIPFADLYFEHINHFDEFHLTSIAEAAGFEKKETGERLLATATGYVIPCIYGVFRRAGQRPLSPAIDRKNTLAARCFAYHERCVAAPLNGRLETLAQSGKPVYVWGMSQFAQLLLGQTALGRCRIKELIDTDKNKQGKKLLGKYVIPPDALQNARSGDVVVLTGIGYQQQMRDYMKKINFQGNEYRLYE
jgi:L-malate glycosyltransferase